MKQNISIDANACYVLRNDVAITHFDDGTLVFQAADSAMLKVNQLSYEILTTLDSRKTLRDIAVEIAALHNESIDVVEQDVLSIMRELEAKRIVKKRTTLPLNKDNTEMSANTKYLCNPDVSLRIEDDDGAILYCPDTAATQIINPVGLEIWETLSTPHTKAELIAHLLDVCEGAPEDGISDDVDEFVARLYSTSFIGKVETNDNEE